MPLERKTRDYTKYAPKPVYNRKIARSMLKYKYKTNKIQNVWRVLKAGGKV